MTRWGKRLVLGCAALFTAVPLLAQTYHGGLRGAVRESGGVVPGVTVTMINEANGATRSTSTNQAGEFAFVQVEPGTYTVKVTMQGFKAVEHKGVRIGTQQFVTMDHTLEVGALEEQITVEGGGVVLETSNASVASTLDSKTLDTLPTAGRNPFFLAITTPGVIPTGDPQFVRQQDQTNSSLLSLGGGPRRGNNYTLDGVSIVDMRNRATVIPSIEAVEEVKVQVSTYDAEMGRTGGGVFNMTGKSGANSWHGSAPGPEPAEVHARACPTSRRRPATKAGPATRGTCTSTCMAARSAARSSRTRPSSGRPPRATGPTHRPATCCVMPTRARAERRLLPERGHHLRPADHACRTPTARQPRPLPRQRHPGRPDQRGGAQPAAVLAGRADEFTAGLKDKSPSRARSSSIRSGATRSAPRRCTRSTTRRSRRPAYFGGEIGEKPGDPGDGALYRTVHALAINNTITPNPTTVAPRALRVHELQRRLRAHGLRPRHPRLLAELRELGPAEEVPVLLRRRLRVLQRPDLRRPRPPGHRLLLLGLQRLDVQAVGPAHRQVRRLLSQDRDEEHLVRGVQRELHLRRPVHERRSVEPHEHRPARAGGPPARLPVGGQHHGRHAERLLHQLLRGVRPGRLPGQLQADRQPGPALRVRAGPAGEGQRVHGRLRP